MFGQPGTIPEEDVDCIDEASLRKRARYVEKCKNALWSRWSSEYLRGLRERHNLKHPKKEHMLKQGDVVIIKGEERNRNKWKLGVVVQMISEGYFRYGRAPSPQAFTGATAKFNMAPS